MTSTELHTEELEGDSRFQCEMFTDRNTQRYACTPKRLSFSVCPYQSTIESQYELDPEEIVTKERKISMNSVKSGSSRRSRYSNRGSLQEALLFDQAILYNDNELFQKRLKATREELMLLRANKARLIQRRNYLQSLEKANLQNSAKKATLLKVALREYFFKAKKPRRQ